MTAFWRLLDEAWWQLRHSRWGQATVASLGLLWVRWWAPALVQVVWVGWRWRQRRSNLLPWQYRAASIRYHWGAAMRIGKLDQDARFARKQLTGQTTRRSRIASIRQTPGAIEVTCERLAGQSEQLWRMALLEVGNQLRLPRPSLRFPSARRVVLVFPRSDRDPDMYEVQPARSMPPGKAVPVAKRAGGGKAKLPLLGSHLLVAGATGSGKGSVIWSIVGALTAGIQSGMVQVWAIDPKGGIELGLGRQVFTRFTAGSDPEQIRDLLASARAQMEARQARMVGHSRLHEPSAAEPWVLIVVDEFLTLTAAIPDKKLRDQVMADLIILLSQGRAVGFTVIAASQVAQKDAIGPAIRDLFTHRVLLRVTTAEQVDMTLGTGARRNGAEADSISDDSPGVGYLLEDGRQPVRVRFPWWSDQAIRALPAAPVVDVQDAELPAVPAPRRRRLSKLEAAVEFVEQQEGQVTAAQIVAEVGVSKTVAYDALSVFRNRLTAPLTDGSGTVKERQR